MGFQYSTTDYSYVSFADTTVFEEEIIRKWFSRSTVVLGGLVLLTLLLILPQIALKGSQLIVALAALLSLTLFGVTNRLSASGRFHAASIALILAFFAPSWPLLILDALPRSYVLQIYFPIVTIASILLKGRQFLGLSIIMLSGVFILAALISQGYVPSILIPASEQSTLDLQFVTIFAFCLISVGMASRTLFKMAAINRINSISLNSELEEVIEARTIELRTAKELAESRSRELSSFLMVMSHEIRTPLTSIVGYADLLESVSNKRDQSEYLGHIKSAGNRLVGTLNSVLELNRLKNDTVDFPVQSTKIYPVVNDAVMLLKGAAEAKGLVLIVENDLDAEGLISESGLSRVLLNLIGNAIKYTDAGFIKVHVEDENEICKIHVEDTGIGMSSEFLSEAYVQFSQESTGEAREHEGSGIGLSVAKRIMDLMNGDIQIESEKNRGTKVTITFPRSPDKLKKEESEKAKRAEMGFVDIEIADR